MPEMISDSATVSDQQMKEFERDGFIVVRGLFAKEEVDQIRETFMDAANDGPIPVLSHADPTWSKDDPLAKYPRMVHPAYRTDLPIGQISMRYMLDERLYAFLKPLMNDEPIAVQSMFYFKPAGARGQALHQDNLYLQVRPGTCMAAWVAIDAADEANGGMMLVPGSQHLDIACPSQADLSQSFTGHLVVPPVGMNPLMVELEPGDCLFFNGNVIHGSSPNSTKDRFRRSLIFHYIPEASEELSRFYEDPRRFDGTSVRYDPSTGGGPCGAETPMGVH